MIAISRTGRRAAPAGPALLRAPAPDGGAVHRPRRPRRRLHALRAHLQDLRARRPAPGRELREGLRGDRAGFRRAGGHRGRDRGALLRGRQGLRRPARAGPPDLAREVPPDRVPHRSQAVRGPPAPLPVHVRAQGDPGQDLRPPGVHGGLRGATRAWRGWSRGSTPRWRPRSCPISSTSGSTRQPAGATPASSGAARPDLDAARSPGAVSLAVGHALLLRR